MSKRKNHSPEFQARRDVFEYIELFYNPKRKHTNNGMLSSVDLDDGCKYHILNRNNALLCEY